jgi:alkylation response protein AidB-like acyl-CoA dehydrogenase
MEFNFSAADIEFRDRVRAKLRTMLPDDIRERQRLISTQYAPVADQRRWFAILDAEGWSVPRWPTEFGGTGWPPLWQYIFEDELHEADAPEFNWPGSHMAGPVICRYGTPEQQLRFLPSIRNGEAIWCQGFSEPNAGSDLASLRTRAQLVGDHYLVNGQKIWTSGAHNANWGFFLVRTDVEVRPQAGISFLLIDMRTPGVTVRQIPQSNGEAHVCEVFLENVKVPTTNLVGEPGKGWTYAKFLLEHERTSSSFVYWNKRELRRTRMMFEAERGSTASHARKLAMIEAQMKGLEWSVLRVLANEKSRYPIDVGASILKLVGAGLQQAITELQVDLLGERAIRFFRPGGERPGVTLEWPEYVAGRTSTMIINRAASIYGGTNEIQRNILAKKAFNI